MTSASHKWGSFNQPQGGCKVTPSPIKRKADGTNRVRSVSKGQHFQARRDGCFHLTPAPLPPLHCSQRCPQSCGGVSGAQTTGVASGGAGSPPARGLHTPLVHVGGSKHKKPARGAARPEAQLSEEVGDDHPHPCLAHRGGRHRAGRGWARTPTPPPRTADSRNA